MSFFFFFFFFLFWVKKNVLIWTLSLLLMGKAGTQAQLICQFLSLGVLVVILPCVYCIVIFLWLNYGTFALLESRSMLFSEYNLIEVKMDNFVPTIIYVYIEINSNRLIKNFLKNIL